MEGITYIKGKEFASLPTTSGVYLLYSGKDLLYIGKAINIRNRVKNHFLQPSYRDNLFITKVNKIGFLETHSEIEALVLEASLIKKHLPNFNVIWKDDKNYFYVALAKNDEKLPYLFVTHQKNDATAEYIGPFVEGTALKKTLRFLRRVFPYYTATKHVKTKCMYCHLNLCPGPNPDVAQYKNNIKKLKLILQGKKQAVVKGLHREMKLLAKQKKFEEAGKVRDQMYHLQQVMSHTKVIEPSSSKDFTEIRQQWKAKEGLLQSILDIPHSITKIECYDISNIQGKQATGSMVVFTEGVPDKNLYRKFRIRMKQEPNDIAMLKEVFIRRFAHPDWPYAEVMLIDGGIAQLNAAVTMKKLFPKVTSKIISIAKGKRELFIEGIKQPIPLKDLPQDIYNIIVYLDDEAHRFAISYHKKLRKKNLLK